MQPPCISQKINSFILDAKSAVIWLPLLAATDLEWKKPPTIQNTQNHRDLFFS